jgi:ribosome biogenesis GTPase A
MGFWPVVMNVLRNSDVVLLLVDARMPDITRNSEIVEKVRAMRGKRLFFVFNKIDLVSSSEISKLKKEYPDSYFISAKKKIGVSKLKVALENMAENWNRSSLRVGLVGYPNIGKSSLINLIAPSARAKVKSISGTTKKTQWVRSGRLRIMDSPGVIPYGDKKVQVGMVAAKDPHKIKNPEKVAFSLLRGKNKRVDFIKKFYGVEGDEAIEIFEAIGRKRGYLVKGGEIDENRTAVKIIDDWQRGRIKLK